uniref:Uncharacterized protein n=1 Tax=Meloidogyne floridensis TaxID=298350 RepID=A0A915NH70_9BILA
MLAYTDEIIVGKLNNVIVNQVIVHQSPKKGIDLGTDTPINSNQKEPKKGIDLGTDTPVPKNTPLNQDRCNRL